jgi:hypothetical protein
MRVLRLLPACAALCPLGVLHTHTNYNYTQVTHDTRLWPQIGALTNSRHQSPAGIGTSRQQLGGSQLPASWGRGCYR